MTENHMIVPGPDHPAYQREPEQVRLPIRWRDGVFAGWQDYQPEPEQVRLPMPLTPTEAMALVAKSATVADEAWERLAAFCRYRGYAFPNWEMVDAVPTADGITIVLERRGE